MSSSLSRGPVSVGRGAPPPVSWRCWPLAAGGRQVWLWLATAAAAATVVGYSTGNLRWATFGALLIALAAWRVFVPVVFEVNAMGISQHLFGRSRRIAWNSIEYLEVGREGVYLSPDGSALAALRGLYVPWEAHRAEVLALVEYFLPAGRRFEMASRRSAYAYAALAGDYEIADAEPQPPPLAGSSETSG
jgi:hypothetical protein